MRLNVAENIYINTRVAVLKHLNRLKSWDKKKTRALRRPRFAQNDTPTIGQQDYQVLVCDLQGVSWNHRVRVPRYIFVNKNCSF